MAKELPPLAPVPAPPLTLKMALWCYVLVPALCCLLWWGMYHVIVQEECDRLWYKQATQWIGGPMPQKMQQSGYGAITVYGEEELSHRLIKTFSMEPSAELPREWDIDYLCHLPTGTPTAAYISPFIIRSDSYPYDGHPTLLRYADDRWVYYLSRPISHSELTELPHSAKLPPPPVIHHNNIIATLQLIILFLLPALACSLPLLWGARHTRYTGTVGRRLAMYGGPIFFWVLQGYLFNDMSYYLGFASSAFIFPPAIGMSIIVVSALWVAEIARKQIFCKHLWHITPTEIAAMKHKTETAEAKSSAHRQALFHGSQTTIHKQQGKK